MKYNIEERIGVHAVAKIFFQELKFFFSEQPVNDFGIDAFVEISGNDEVPSGKLIGVQIKSGQSYFKESEDEHIIFRGSKKHLEYWLNHSLSVLIIIYDKTNDTAYWQAINTMTVLWTKQSFKVKIPKKNVLDNKSREAIAGLALFKNRHQYRLWQLQTSIAQIELLLEKKRLFLYVEIDSIPYSDFYNITLVVLDKDHEGYPEVFYNWDFDDPNWFDHHFYLFKDWSIAEALNDTIPWADLFLDGFGFTDELLTSVLADDILSFDQEDFAEEVCEFRAQNSFLELACYLTGSSFFQLELKANTLAHAFLLVDLFLNKEPLVKTRTFF